MQRAVPAVVVVLLLLQPGAARPQAETPSLAHFKNYFLTGDYVVGGTSLWRKGVAGRAVESIEIDGVPDNADVVAAYLYIQTAEASQLVAPVGSVPTPGLMVLIATATPSSLSHAWYTAPMPPAPSSLMM